MSLDYALCYLQLEDMQKRARVQGGIAYIKKEYHEKIQKIMLWATSIYVGVFITIQIALLILTTLEVVSTQAFVVELNTLIFFLMIFLNAFALVSYCRNAGNPYLTEKNKKYVRKFKLVIVIWNFAFLLKFVFSSVGVSVLDYDDKEKSESDDDFWYSVQTFLNIMFTEIIPFYFILDKKIVKIFTLKFLEVEVATDSEETAMDDERALDSQNRDGTESGEDLESRTGSRTKLLSSGGALLSPESEPGSVL